MESGALRRYLPGRLPDNMVPADIREDRAAAADGERQGGSAGNLPAPEERGTREGIRESLRRSGRACWRGIWGQWCWVRERVGREDNFFELGVVSDSEYTGGSALILKRSAHIAKADI